MTDSDKGPPQFYVLCLREKQAQYDGVLAASPYEFGFVYDVLELLIRCMQAPPLAVMIDTMSSARMGAGVINPLLELRMGWPILRCTARPDGTANVMCIDPDRRGTLQEATDAIVAGDRGWLPAWGRRYMRVAVECRARLRMGDESRWRLGNCLDISRSGAFVVNYESVNVGDALELEIRDLLDEPASLPAQVARSVPLGRQVSNCLASA